MNPSTTPLSCNEVHESLAEVALGTLTGRERSAALEHAGTCSRCGAALAELMAVNDSILLLAPETEPPVGFELRLARRLSSDRPRRRPPRLRPLLQWVAVVVALVLGLGVGWAVLGGGTAGTSGQVASASLVADGRTVGEVLLVEGTPARLLMTVDSEAVTGVVRCQVGLADGKFETVGRFALSGGYGAWHVTLPKYASPVLTAQVVAANGTVLGRAHLGADNPGT